MMSEEKDKDNGALPDKVGPGFHLFFFLGSEMKVLV